MCTRSNVMFLHFWSLHKCVSYTQHWFTYGFAGMTGGVGMPVAIATILILVGGVIIKRRRASKCSGECSKLIMGELLLVCMVHCFMVMVCWSLKECAWVFIINRAIFQYFENVFDHSQPILNLNTISVLQPSVVKALDMSKIDVL